jgi:hypothetical protein
MHRTSFRILLIGALMFTVLSLVGSPAEAARAPATQPALAQVGTFSNGAAITVGTDAVLTLLPATPYPSTIAVSGLLGSITDVDVTLSSVSHSRPDDFDVLVVGPGGQSVILMSDACDTVDPGGVNYTFSDQAAAPLENGSGTNCSTTGTYQPSNYDGSANSIEPDDFPAPGPGQVGGALLSGFNGTTANGTWSLYVVDDRPAGSQGGINGGWSLTITTDSTAPTITSAAPPNGTDGVAYSHTYTATGNPAPTFALTLGAFPPGLSLVGAVLSGTPTTPGTYTGTVTASNGVSPDATQPFSITIGGAAPTITSAPPGGGVVGSAYSHTYTATGSTPISFALTAGAFPDGLSLAGAVLSGTPTTTGTFTGTVTASNGFGTDTQDFSIIITAAPVAPTITSAPPADGVIGTAYSHTYTATGSTPISFALTAGAFPPGLSLAGAVLSGTPTATGTYTGTVTASNGTAPDDTQDFSITITTTPRPPAGGSTAYVPTAADHARAQAPLCSLMGGGTNIIVRADVPAGTVTGGSVFCRVIVENSVYVNGNSPAEVGNQDVINRGVVQAVDVFGLLTSGLPQPDFNASIKVCLQGSGGFLYLNALTAPRTVSALPVSLEGGYSCAFIPDAGTVVLVQDGPAADPSAPVASGGASGPLNGCTVTTLHILNLRSGPGTDSDVIRVVPYNVTLTATQRQGDWFNVDYMGTPGWLNAAFVAPDAACG